MRKLITILLAVLITQTIDAQEVLKLSLNEAISIGHKNSKQLQLDSLKIQALEFKKKQTQNAMIPVIAVQSSYTRLSDNIEPFVISIPGLGSHSINTNIPNQYNNRVSVQQPIFQGLRNWNTLKAINEQKIATQFEQEKNAQDLSLSIVQAYYSLFKMQQTKILLDSTIARTQVRVDDITKFKEAGLVLNNDVMRAELQKNNFQITRADVESNIDVLNYNLCILLGINPATKIEVDKPEAVVNSSISIDNLIASSMIDRPELKIQKHKNKYADYMVKASRSAYMPTISAIGNGVYSNPNQRVFPPEAKFKATWDVGISLSWNIMQLYTARAIVGEAKNQKAQILKVTEQINDGIAMEVNANNEAVKVSLSKIELAQKAIEQATENKRILDNRFQAQVALLSDVLEADQLLLQAQANLLNAQADAMIAKYKLERSLGTIK